MILCTIQGYTLDLSEIKFAGLRGQTSILDLLFNNGKVLSFPFPTRSDAQAVINSIGDTMEQYHKPIDVKLVVPKVKKAKKTKSESKNTH